jgi:hypothetical protein
MGTTHGYRVASPNVHSLTFEDEVVAIDMETGLYFSLRGAAVDIWTAAVAGAGRDAIVAALEARYESAGPALAIGVDRCLAELVGHGLLVADPAVSGAVVPDPTGPAGPRAPFAEPVIERFTDMQELLLLDPIHEVADTGWPIPRTPERG